MGEHAASLSESAREAVKYVGRQHRSRPKVGIILGSGLGGLAELVEQATCVPYEETPYLARSTAIGHQGQFVCGRLGGVEAIVMQGRFHLYEGYATDDVTLPVEVMCGLGKIGRASCRERV